MTRAGLIIALAIALANPGPLSDLRDGFRLLYFAG
jgi:hypothetical protein